MKSGKLISGGSKQERGGPTKKSKTNKRGGDYYIIIWEWRA